MTNTQWYKDDRPIDRIEEYENKGKPGRFAVLIPVSKIFRWLKKKAKGEKR